MELVESIREIPARIDRIIQEFDDTDLRVEDYLKRFHSPIDEIIFIGSGTSYNAAFAIKNFVEKNLKMRVTLYYPNDFRQKNLIINKNAVYVLISQSGKTAVLKECLEFLASNHLIHITITSDDQSILSQLSDLHLNMRTEEEAHVFRTKGYSCTVAVCICLTLAISKFASKITTLELEKFLEDLKKLPHSIQNIIDISTQWTTSNLSLLDHKNCILVSGEGALWAVSQEASIKFMEMIPILSDSYEIEEFIHGPQNAFHSDILYILLYNKAYDSSRALKIHDFIAHEIGDCILIGNENLGKNDLTITFQSTYFYFLEAISACQILAYYFAKHRNRDLTKRINSVIDRYISKSL